MDNKILFGLGGTAISGIGASLSISELQGIISIVITILGFIISVLIPLGLKFYNKIKDAKKDGVITKEEIEDIANTGKEIIEKTESVIDEIKKGEDK